MPEEHWTWQCERLIPSELGAGKQVLDALLDQLKAHQWVPHDIFGVHLAMHEALVNAVTHGNRLDASKHIHVRCQLAPDLVRVEITDEGEGFDPSRLPDPTDPDRLELPTGRGVMLMKAFMSHVEFSPRGNRVTMEKHRENQAAGRIAQAGEAISG